MLDVCKAKSGKFKKFVEKAEDDMGVSGNFLPLFFTSIHVSFCAEVSYDAFYFSVVFIQRVWLLVSNKGPLPARFLGETATSTSIATLCTKYICSFLRTLAWCAILAFTHLHAILRSNECESYSAHLQVSAFVRESTEDDGEAGGWRWSSTPHSILTTWRIYARTTGIR